MSEITRGAIGMPFELAMSSELSRRQFHSIAQALLAERDEMEITITHLEMMIEHLRGGPTPLFTAVDMGTTAADGFRDGVASAGKDAERYRHLKASWHDGGLIDRLAANVLPEDWDAAVDADMSKEG